MKEQEDGGLLKMLFGVDEKLVFDRIHVALETTHGFTPYENGRLYDSLVGFERHLLQEALLRAEGNVSAAAETIGVDRKTMHRKIKKLGLEEALGKIREHKEVVEAQQKQGRGKIVLDVLSHYLPLYQLSEPLKERVLHYGVPKLCAALQDAYRPLPHLDGARDRFLKSMVEEALRQGEQKEAIAYSLGRSTRTLNRLLQAA